MKKLSLVAAFAIMAVIANAQLGIKAGVNFSSWHGEDISSSDVDMLTGFFGGVFYNIKATEMFSVPVDAVYSAEGVKEANSSTDLKIKTNFLNVSALFQYNNPSGFFIGTGPQIGFLLSADAKDNTGSVDVKDAFKSTNFSWAFAVGYRFQNGFGIGARYNLGLSNISDDSSDDVKTGVLRVGVGYTFSLGKGQSAK